MNTINLACYVIGYIVTVLFIVAVTRKEYISLFEIFNLTTVPFDFDVAIPIVIMNLVAHSAVFLLWPIIMVFFLIGVGCVKFSKTKIPPTFNKYLNQTIDAIRSLYQ